MRIRIMTGLFWGLFIAIVTYIGGVLFDFIYYGIICIGIYELSKAINNKNAFSYETTLNVLLLSMLVYSKYYLSVYAIAIIMIMYLSLVFVIFVIKSDYTVNRLSNTVFTGAYVVGMLYHMILLNESHFVWLVYFIAFGTDTFAYFAGVSLGKHKLCPTISPKKTIEGAIGGILGCVLIVITYFFILKIDINVGVILFSIFASVFSMFGDLVASKIKREYNIKDYGNFLRGHGGILDRFDSVMFVAPLVYYFSNYFI